MILAEEKHTAFAHKPGYAIYRAAHIISSQIECKQTKRTRATVD